MKRSLREILAPMSWRERFDYIWEYYKWPIIVCLFLTFVIGSMTHDLITKKEVALNMFVITHDANMEKVEDLEQRLHEWIIPQDEQDEKQIFLQIHAYDKTENGLVFPQGVLEKLLVEMNAQTLDILLLPEGEFRKFQPLHESFLDLATLLDKPFPVETQDLITGENQQIVAIRVKAVPELYEMFPDPDLVLCIPRNSLQTNNSKIVLEKFLYNR
ncbi:MAG: hypothetical protein FWJ66_08965 [Caldibacillus sp.]